MPSGWVHAVIDLIAYGRSYFDLHKEKDKHYKILGPRHRCINHGWYQNYGRIWSFCDPFPSWLKESIRIVRNKRGLDEAEEQMARIDHDYIDKMWDTLSEPEKQYWEGFFAWILFSPKILKDWARVDVLKAKIQRIINNREVWESCLEIKSEYKRLCNYIKAVTKGNKALQETLEVVKFNKGQIYKKR